MTRGRSSSTCNRSRLEGGAGGARGTWARAHLFGGYVAWLDREGVSLNVHTHGLELMAEGGTIETLSYFPSDNYIIEDSSSDHKSYIIHVIEIARRQKTKKTCFVVPSPVDRVRIQQDISLVSMEFNRTIHA